MNAERRPRRAGTASTSGRAAEPKSNPDVRQSDDAALFDITITVGAYGAVSTAYDTGTGRRDQGHSQASRRIDNGWRDKVLAVIRDRADLPGTFTMEDIRRDVADDAINPAAWGTVMLAARRRGWIRRVGFVIAERPERHAAPLALWEGIRD